MTNAKNKNKKINRLVKEYLKENPAIKEALDIFSISERAYTESLRSLNGAATAISTKSTTI